MKTAIIMGAGPAGLTTAYELLTRTDIRPVIIERDDQVGGLSKTISYKENLIDIGGHRFFSKSKKITDWWLSFLPLENRAGDTSLTYHHYTTTLHSQASHLNGSESSSTSGNMLVRPRKSRIYFNNAFFDYPLSLNRKTLNNFGFGKICRITGSYLRSKISPIKNEKTLEDFFINRFGRELYLTFFKGYTEKIWGVDCVQIPADWGRQRIKDLNIGKAARQSLVSLFSTNRTIHQEGVSTSLIEQFLYPQKGPGQMWEAVAAKIISMGGEIRLQTRVEKIHTKDRQQIREKNTDRNKGINNIKNNPDSTRQIESIVCRNLLTNESEEITGDYFFSTIPVQHLIAGFEKTTIPQEIRQITDELQYRDFMIVGLLFKKPENTRGTLAELTDNWIYLQDENLVAGRLQLFNNWSPYMVKDETTIWVGLEYFCKNSDTIWNMEENEMIRFACEELKKTGLINQEELLDGTVIKVPKAYPSYIGSYDQFEKVQTYMDRFENLFLIGRNGMHRYNNTDHSMMTAMTAVDNIILNQKSRENIWAVNMEQDFHEEK